MTATKTLSKRAAKVLIVDDHPVVREGLAMRIARQPNLEVCGEASDVSEALHLLDVTNPDVAVVDISLKTGSGIDLIKRIKARNHPVRILVWSMHSESLYAERALRAGAMGYITKEQAPSKIVDAITKVLEDKIYLSDEASAQLLNRAVGRGKNDGALSPVESLSDRELQVFEMFGQGLDTHQVAERMHLSPKTVETYRARIKEKLDIATVSELVCKAVQWVLESR